MSQPRSGKEIARAPSKPKLSLAVPVWQRWVAAVPGMALTIAGTYSVVLAGHDGLGSVALILCGVFLGVFAIIGRLPNRIWGKDMGIEFLTTEEAEELVDELPRGSRREIMNALVPASSAGLHIAALAPTIQISNAAAESDLFEMLCDQFVEREVLPQLRSMYARRMTFKKPGTGNNFRDAVIDIQEGEIVLQYRLRLTREAVRKSAEFVRITEQAIGRPQAMIILVKTLDMDPLIEAAARPAEESGRFHVAQLPSADSQVAKDQVLSLFRSVVDSIHAAAESAGS